MNVESVVSMATTLRQVIARGLIARCPRCADDTIVTRLLTVRPACDACGLDLSHEDSGDGPTVFLIFGIGLIAAIALLVMVFALNVAIWLGIVIMIPMVFGLTVLLLRPAKALLIALAWFHRSGDNSAKR